MFKGGRLFKFVNDFYSSLKLSIAAAAGQHAPGSFVTIVANNEFADVIVMKAKSDINRCFDCYLYSTKNKQTCRGMQCDGKRRFDKQNIIYVNNKLQ